MNDDLDLIYDRLSEVIQKLKEEFFIGDIEEVWEVTIDEIRDGKYD